MDKGRSPAKQHSTAAVPPRPPVLREARSLCLRNCVVTDMAALQGSGNGTVAEGLFVKRHALGELRALAVSSSPKLDRPGLASVAYRSDAISIADSFVPCPAQYWPRPAVTSAHSHARGLPNGPRLPARVAIAHSRARPSRHEQYIGLPSPARADPLSLASLPSRRTVFSLGHHE